MLINTPMGYIAVPLWVNHVLPLMLVFLVLVLYSLILYFVYYLESDGFFADFCIINGTISIGMLFWSLWIASRRDPGFVPKATIDSADLEDTDTGGEEQKEEAIVPNEPRFCQFCQIKKPERCHHCSRCSRCVLHMDHHCIWTGNCVGLQNRKAFILILFWGSVGLLFGTLQILPFFPYFLSKIQESYNNQEFWVFARYTFLSMLFLSSIANFAGLSYFLSYHIRLISSGQTTFDQIFEINDNHYDLGQLNNMKFYFGNNYYQWVIPIGEPQGDGYYWTKKDHDFG